MHKRSWAFASSWCTSIPALSVSASSYTPLFIRYVLSVQCTDYPYLVVVIMALYPTRQFYHPFISRFTVLATMKERISSL